MASSRIEMDDYENATKLEEDLEIYEEIETAHEDIKKDPMLKFQTAPVNINKDPVLVFSVKKWLQFVLLPLLIVSLLSVSLILTVAYFALYADLEAKMEKRYAYLMTKQDINATAVHAIVNDARSELEFEMERNYASLMTKQNISATEIHALVNEAREIKTFESKLAEEGVKIKTLEKQVEDNNRKVAVTACVSSDQKFSDGVVRFSTVNFQEGIDNIDTFKSSGKFVCKIPGLFYISAHIFTTTPTHAFYVMKNGIVIASSASDSDSSYSTNPISAVVELQLKDTLYISTSTHSIRGTFSCLTIMKVK
ncbi:uncharacterized protein [Mytilus edulis]|uniref:uncharacterized protein n=1 Tax=Mytilus edulis TaxID=6550 RepID=UPI0039F05454